MSRILSLITVTLLLALGAKAQERGTVKDQNGEPIAGASIQIKGKNTGTTADATGAFSIHVKKGDKLIVSAVGYTPQQVNPENGLNITLERAAGKLDELLITTALGIKRTRNSLPYATQQVSGDDLNKTLNTDFVNNLSGKVAGLQVTSSNITGGSNNVILRGMKSLTQSNQALFVVDGVPYDNTNQSQNLYDLGNAASDINPEDIESVSVLKGAAASALYGSRASNGVILITTKKNNRKYKGLGITLTSGVTVGSPDKSTLPTYQTQYGEGYGSQGYNAAYPNQSGFFYYEPVFNSNGQPVNIVQTDVDAATGPAYDPNTNVYTWQSFVPGDPNYGKATPWQPAAHHNPVDFFQTPVTTSTSLFADQADEKGGLRVGLTRSEDKGLLPNNDVTKTLITLNTTRNLTDEVSIGGDLNYSDVNGLGRAGYGYTSSENPMMDFREWWPTNVDLKAQKADYFRNRTNASWNWLGGYLTPGQNIPAYHNNIYWNRYENFENDERQRYFGNIHLNYKITDYLSLTTRVSLDDYTQSVEYRTAKGSVHTSSYTRYDAKFGETNYDLLLNFNKDLYKNLNLKALLGGNVRQDNNTSETQATNGGLVVPDVYALANSVNTPLAPTEYVSTKEVDGIFVGATLSYKETVTLDATLRRDRSSTLPEAHNTYYYPSVSGNVVFSKWIHNAPWLTYGKLRANYAEVGGDAPVFSVTNTYQYVNPFHGQPLSSAAVVNNNANLLPEKNRSYEFGLEAEFLHGRIGFDLTYYHALQIDQIMPITTSSASGYNTYYVNGGSVQNQGVELSANATPVRTKDFSWRINLNWSMNRNKVLSLYGGQPSYVIGNYGFNTQLVAEAGKPYGVIRGSDYTYKNGQRITDPTTGEYVLNGNALSDIGNINPDWIGGIGNTFSYKNVSLSFLVDVSKGGQLYSLDMDFGDYSGLYPETAGLNDRGKPVRAPLSQGGGIILPGVTPDGKANTIHVDASDINQGNFPFSSYNAFADRSYVYDASYVKLREVAITWSVPHKGLGFVKGIDLSLTGRNLWIIHKNLPYSDPEQGLAVGSETGSGAQNGSTGFQVGAYPSVRTIGVNAILKF
ncbi:SusC/RagA family TonB-linked outer membrane protein [Dinghuibacter silviterrae]|uniref:TonB-linked SusC/RagA family outer membrane protein n=1 Tax=Dinghuibacter silviterrae TaxID=1539049 RepID=A0A4R8DVB9_9BACT|nr:SusC/RagA family TonB-linked outer membrane protein [Dinghuibacter silviterrae]TDX01956.1 TonB-linked SusC/RagA family outer membrane protein [Dinghuibacter silviterrae]